MLIVRLIILFGLVFGIAFGATRAIRIRRERKRLAERDAARDRIRELREAFDRGEIERPQYDQLTYDIYRACREKGIELDDERPQLSEPKS
jgi:uncharacterized membrane protein